MNQLTRPNFAATAAQRAGSLEYLTGFGNQFETEALPGALPVGRNSPQKCPYGLYAEQLSGSPFTAPRTTNERSWLYRIRPTVAHWGRFAKTDIGLWRTAPARETEIPIGPLRWDPIPIPKRSINFVEGVHTIATAGDAAANAGMGAHVYIATRSMVDEYFYNADGEMLVVPQVGALRFCTEFGIVDVEPGEVAILPRGVKMRVELKGGPARGYICENYGGAFSLPERGPIGANCMANPRDFLTPVAAYEDREAPSKMLVKWGGALWAAEIAQSPLDVVAWHGNYAPYKYDLRRYSPVGPILYDHADPSIFTVLTSPSETAGTANVDFVIFTDRWLVAENTFRPPWYHMNVMSEFMGLVYGVYDAKTGGGFVPGGMSLHNSMLPHGPDVNAFERASSVELKPHKLEGTLAFMFETRFAQSVTRFAAESASLQKDYGFYGDNLKRHFDPREAVRDIAGRGIGSILVGGRVLGALADAGRPLMLREIAAGAELTSAQAHAYLVSFRKIGLVEQTGDGLYRLGPFALQLGLARMRSVDCLRLATEAAPALARELKLMTTVTVWGSFGATVVQVNEGGGALHVNLRAGVVYSLLHTATGRVFAAFLPEDVGAAHLEAARAAPPLYEPTDVAATPALLREVARTRARGYAIASGSPIPGVNALAAPVRDHTGALKLALTVIGPAALVDISPESPLAARLLACTDALSAELGFRAREVVEFDAAL